MAFVGTTEAAPARDSATSGARTAPERHGAGRALVIGLGNPILGDDGVGWRVVDAVERRLGASRRRPDTACSIELDRLAIGGLGLMERMVGYDRVVLIDALIDGSRPGSVSSCPLGEMPPRLAGHLDSAHDVPLSQALAAGRSLDAPLPRAVDIVGITVVRVDAFDDRLTPPVAAVVDDAADLVMALLERSPGGA